MAISSDYLAYTVDNKLFNNTDRSYEDTELLRLRKIILSHENTIERLNSTIRLSNSIDGIEKLQSRVKELQDDICNKDFIIRNLELKESHIKLNIEAEYNKKMLQKDIELRSKDGIIKQLQEKKSLDMLELINLNEKLIRELEKANNRINYLENSTSSLYKDCILMDSKWKEKTIRHKLESGKRLILKDIECREFIVDRFREYIESYNKSTCGKLEVEYNSNQCILSLVDTLKIII